MFNTGSFFKVSRNSVKSPIPCGWREKHTYSKVAKTSPYVTTLTEQIQLSAQLLNTRWASSSLVLQRDVRYQSIRHTAITFSLVSLLVSFLVTLDVSCFGSPYRYMETHTSMAPEANVKAAQERKISFNY